jgi:glutathione S-transferase
METIKVSAFRWVPPFAQGLVRDLRVRWACEEAGVPYQAQLISREDQNSDEYRKVQPFGQVPVVEADGLSMFESGACVMHIAEQHEALMPKEPQQRAQVKTWMFAALNTIETPIMMLVVMDFQPEDVRAGTTKLRTAVLDRIGNRLDSLVKYLGSNDYLVGNRFSAADVLMLSVLRALRTTDLVAKRPTLEAYRLRCEARPAFQRALSAQMETFAANAPPPAS